MCRCSKVNMQLAQKGTRHLNVPKPTPQSKLSLTNLMASIFSFSFKWNFLHFSILAIFREVPPITSSPSSNFLILNFENFVFHSFPIFIQRFILLLQHLPHFSFLLSSNTRLLPLTHFLFSLMQFLFCLFNILPISSHLFIIFFLECLCTKTEVVRLEVLTQVNVYLANAFLVTTR